MQQHTVFNGSDSNVSVYGHVKRVRYGIQIILIALVVCTLILLSCRKERYSDIRLSFCSYSLRMIVFVFVWYINISVVFYGHLHLLWIECILQNIKLEWAKAWPMCFNFKTMMVCTIIWIRDLTHKLFVNGSCCLLWYTFAKTVWYIWVTRCLCYIRC